MTEKKYLNLYNSEGEFGATLDDKTNKNPNISYVISSGVHYGDTPYFSGDDAIAGDIFLTNGTDKFFTTPEYYKNLKEKGKIGTGEGLMTPIGVCAIPAALTLLGEEGENKGKARVLGLACMSLKTPTTGRIIPGYTEGDNNMYWGDNTKSLGTVDWRSGKYIHPITGVVGSIDWVRLPSTSEMPGEYNPHINELDPKKPMYYMNQFSTEVTRFGCSPYDTTGGYFSGSYANLNGKENTDKLIKAVTANWSGSTIENSVAAGHCPSACSCRRYTTAGTKAGDWYLPSIGELGIMWARMKEINDSIYLIGPSYGIPVGTYKECKKSNNVWNNFGYWLWSSTETNTTYARYLDCYYGYTYHATKSNLDSGYSRVRAFLAA